MAYEKQTWVDGVTPLDAEHLNHMEQGIGQLSEPIVNNEFRTAQKRNRTRKALFLQASKHQIVVPSGS